MPSFLERHCDRIAGVVSCFDRVIIQGTLPDICHPKAITQWFYAQKIRIFDFKSWAAPMRDQIKDNIEKIAAEDGLEIEFVRKQRDFRKEQRVKAILAQRGDHPGVVHVFSAMESCTAFKPWHDKQTHATFRLQFYFNGHNWPARQFQKQGIGYQQVENAFVQVDDFKKAQKLADRFPVKRLRRLLDRYARKFCPAVVGFASGIHWSIMQAEYATDVIFAGRSYRGFNLFSAEDEAVLRAITQGGVQGFGIRNSALRATLGKTSGQVSRILKRLRNHGLIKKVANVYKYHLTSFGRHVVATSLKLKELFIIPVLRGEMHFA